MFSGPITPSGTVNSATPATNFTGNTGPVTVGLSALYTRNGASVTLYAPNVGINVGALPKPTISGLPAASAPNHFPVLCQPTTLTASATGANTYTWAVTGGLTLSATTGSSVTVYPPSNASGTGSISVTASNTNAPAGTCQTTNGYNVSLSNPASGTYTSDSNGNATQMTESYQFVPANQTYYILMDQNYDFTFTTVGPNGTPGIPIYKTGPRTAYFYFPGSSVQVVATATGSNVSCGQSSLSSVFIAPYSYAMMPNPASSELTITDNLQPDNSRPATTSAYTFKNAGPMPLSIPLQAFDATLYDLHGKPVKAQASVVGKTVINVRDLPAGLYNLRITNGKYVHSEHIQITH